MRNITFKVIPDPQGPPNSKTQPSPRPEEKPICMLGEKYPPANCPPIEEMPPLGQMPPFSPLLPFEQMPPFEPIAPLMPESPFQGMFPNPAPEPIIPVLPGYVNTPWLAHAYVPWQFYAMSYPPAEALSQGTLFPELYQPQGEYGPCEGPKPCKMVYPRGGALDVDE